MTCLLRQVLRADLTPEEAAEIADHPNLTHLWTQSAMRPHMIKLAWKLHGLGAKIVPWVLPHLDLVMHGLERTHSRFYAAAVLGAVLQSTSSKQLQEHVSSLKTWVVDVCLYFRRGYLYRLLFEIITKLGASDSHFYRPNRFGAVLADLQTKKDVSIVAKLLAHMVREAQADDLSEDRLTRALFAVTKRARWNLTHEPRCMVTLMLALAQVVDCASDKLKRKFVAANGHALVFEVLGATCSPNAKYNAARTLEHLLAAVEVPVTSEQRSACLHWLVECADDDFATGALVTLSVLTVSQPGFHLTGSEAQVLIPHLHDRNKRRVKLSSKARGRLDDLVCMLAKNPRQAAQLVKGGCCDIV